MRQRVLATGVVQGVGFRPFVYGAATELGLAGWVCNTSAGVEIEIEGTPGRVAEFLERLRLHPPPLARLERIVACEIPTDGSTIFHIRESVARAGVFQPVSPDIATCAACRREVADPGDRRFGYPFTNCTHCGPRFTIVLDLPYDRAQTTMAAFEMCPSCRREYEDPRDRRFHAQPNACPACGPSVWLERPGRPVSHASDALAEARRLIATGHIVAVKGLGGFHLACDAADARAVSELRRRKGRVGKPFAVMAADHEAAGRLSDLTPLERQLLASREAPIVLCRRRPDAPLASDVAPGQVHVGVMLPYTPLHLSLLGRAAGYPEVLVMTSGNYAEEPIATDNEAARRRLSALADAILMHDREIHARCDDSVARVVRGGEMPLRRSRGYAPYPVRLPFRSPSVLACGAELKNTFCLTREDHAFLSQHIGDLENQETLESFEATVEHFQTLFRTAPEAVAHDLHPDYLATRFARSPRWRELPRLGVQHHHAHVAACMAEHGLPAEAQVLGLAFDGTGYGTDGTIWGGEVLICGYSAFERIGHLRRVALPGGDAAVRRPHRMALVWLAAAGVPWREDLAPVAAASERERVVVEAFLAGRVRAPVTSSAGRLFDAAAAIAGVRQIATYEAQAAIELEAVLDPSVGDAYPFGVADEAGVLVLDPAPTIAGLVRDTRAGEAVGVMSARFHNAIADMALVACDRARAAHGIDAVCLSGGVFQNVALLERVIERLEATAFRVYWHRLVPPNDGGVSLGQAAVAAARLRG